MPVEVFRPCNSDISIIMMTEDDNTTYRKYDSDVSGKKAEENGPSFDSYSIEDQEESVEQDMAQGGAAYDNYRLPEDDEDTLNGNSGPDYHRDDDDDDDNEEDGENESDNRKPSPFVTMLKILFSPVEGWKSLKRTVVSPDSFASGCFYPLVALASVSVFFSKFYGADDSLQSMLTNALVVFISFFMGYFCILLLCGIVLPKECRKRIDTHFGKKYVMAALSSLALFFAIFSALPMLEPVLVFLPLWTLFCVCRGVRFLRVPKDREMVVSTVLCALILGAPIALAWLFSEILPSSAQL